MGPSPSASMGVLLDHARDKIILLDETGQVTYANQALECIAGWAPEAFEGEHVFDYVHPEDVAAARAAFEQTIDSDEFTESTACYRFRTRDGDWIWLESRMSNLTDEQLEGYVVSSRDITEQVEARRARRETAQRLQELSATAGDVLWMFSGDWSELLFVNSAYEEVYGQSVEELEQDPETFLNAIHPDDVPAVEDAMECLSAGDSVDMEYRVNPETDYKVWVWVQAEPIIEDGEVVRITGFTRDITERRRRERQLFVMDNLLRHNLRNDLNIISGTAQLIEDRAPEVADEVAIIRRTSEQLLSSAEKEREIIDILTREFCPRPVDVAAASEAAAARVREAHPAADVAVSAPSDVFAHALDEIRVAAVELLENSIVHSEHGSPSVSLTVERDADRVRLVITDDAPPIPEMEASVLRGDHEMDEMYHSSGLGFWLVYWIVELSDGQITVDRAGQGNRIVISLPGAQGVDADTAAAGVTVDGR